MPLTAGTLLGPYEIISPLGAGGMGEVYRAQDTQLKRDVALKVLPDVFSQDPDRLARFQREAQLLATLNHPNIAHIHGLQDSNGVRALVMELVEGPDLAERIARPSTFAQGVPSGGEGRGLPLDEALPIAKQIAEALESAHEQGIVHRDLKPANIKVRHDGTVKVLDFGLAKAMEPAAGPAPNMSMSPTLSMHATQSGVILGTAAYMAPEQARGKSVDKRADIWAFGAVLFEMLTARSAFAGDTIADTIAAVVTREPDWTTLPASVPPSLRRLLTLCLEKDPKRRLRDIGDARLEIERILSGVPEVPSDAPPRAATSNRRPRLAWISVGLMAVVTAIAVGVAWFRPPAVPPAAAAAMRFAFVPPENLTVEDVGFDDIIVSPDGTKLVFTAREGDGRRQLWVRSLETLDARLLPDTEDAIEPFWSPDSQSVGFGAAGKLKRVDIAGKRAQTLADAARLNGGSSWSRDGVIVFNPDYGAGLLQVAATGGPATKLRESGLGPCFLPNGRQFIYNKGGSVFVGSLDSDTDLPLPGITNRVFYAAHPAGAPAFAGGATGWLLYVKNAELLAQPFDAGRAALAGEPVRVATDPAASAGLSEARRFVSVSDTGVMVLMTPQARDYQLLWVDRAGKALGTLGPVTRSTVASAPSISPDGTHVAMQRRDPKTPGQDIWVSDLSRGTLDRVTAGPVNSQLPVWSSDGRHVFFQTVRDGVGGIYRVGANGGDQQLVLKGTVFPGDMSPDGRFLLYWLRGQSTRMDVWALPTALQPSTGSGRREPFPLLDSQFDETGATLSPDGQWLAYQSDVTGIEEVYVRRFDADHGTVGEPLRISTGSGTRPRWRGDGTELFYLAAPQGGTRVQMIAVSTKTGGAALQAGTPTTLFTTRMLPFFTDYDATRDGQRFLVGTILDASNAARPSAIVVLNWMAELKK
jgi:Tol biopolymer transport system component